MEKQTEVDLDSVSKNNLQYLGNLEVQFRSSRFYSVTRATHLIHLRCGHARVQPYRTIQGLWLKPLQSSLIRRCLFGVHTKLRLSR